jgi:hypothetical protein
MSNSEMMEWQNRTNLPSRNFHCGHCSKAIASNNGYVAVTRSGYGGYIYTCHFCTCPTFFNSDSVQVPAPLYGDDVEHLPVDIERLYNQARLTSNLAPTASALCSRKLLMNIAVSKNAKEGESFAAYVDYLNTNGFIPPDGTQWVDHIRKIGNEATHEIKFISVEDARELVDFLEMLLKFIYEFPGRMQAKQKTKNP